MRPDFEKILDVKEQSFISKKIVRKNRPLLSSAWHYHPELEICYTKRSRGKRYVGNRISDYQEGDLVMFGSNLPHGFTTTEKTTQIVIQFHQEFLLNMLKDNTDFIAVKKFCDTSKMGLEFYGNIKIKAIKIIKSITKKSGIEQLILLLNLISLLSTSKELSAICTKEYSAAISLNQLTRMKTVFDFIEENYQNNITITDAAREINLTDSAFYKFIKRHTKKKFTQILNEYRINHASKLLINTQMTVAETCFDSGFKNLSYFNRKFKEAFYVSPTEFRMKHS